jgi:eukaryotic-like serine/threonine-protein kinase
VLEAQSRRDDAIRFYTVARAIRPETAHEMAHALSNRGESDEAIEIFRELARLRPGNGRHAACLAENLRERGRSKEAAAALEQGVASLREAIRLRPGAYAGHNNLGLALVSQGKLDEAVTEYREAIRLQPDYFEAHCNLGFALQALGTLDLAVA